MSEQTISNKMQTSTAIIFRENLECMVQFGIINERQKEFLDRVLGEFKYSDKKLSWNAISIFFEYDKDLFAEDLLALVGNTNIKETNK